MEKVTFKNVKLQWACLDKPHTRGEFPSNKYQVDVIFDKDLLDTVNSLKNKKQVVKDLGDGTYSMTLKSGVKPTIYNAVMAKMSDEDIEKIGNGTVAHVNARQYDSKFGTMLGLQAVKILKLEEYSNDSFGDGDDVADADIPFDSDDEELI